MVLVRFVQKCFLAFLGCRQGANPYRVVSHMRSKLHHNAALVHLPMGLESDFSGIVDIIRNKAIYYEGQFGENVREGEVPSAMEAEVAKRRQELIETVANVDDVLGEIFLEEKQPTLKELQDAIRRSTIKRLFVPVFLGSALKNKGVQTLLDGILDYMPNPFQIENFALDPAHNEAKVLMDGTRDSANPFVGLAFKLEAGRFGQLTYMRVYQGRLRRGDFIGNTRSGKKKSMLETLLLCLALNAILGTHLWEMELQN
eukprot:m.27163 g.27163  ORF g.27163 m.27163 type:complete len:257 (+) comp29829_c0_seq6:31-801(+)